MELCQPTILAANDIVSVIITIVVFVVWGIGQLMGAKGQAAKEPKLKGVRRVPKGPQPGAQPPNQADALRRQVEQFLHRVQGEPSDEAEAEPPARSGRVGRPLSQRTESDTDSRSGEGQRGQFSSSQPLSKPLSQSSEKTLRSEGVAEHVARHLGGSQELAEHAEHLGEVVGQTDERLAARLHQKFDHQIGSLQRAEPTAADAQPEEPSVTDDIMQLLSTPDGMRQAILANEILRRPIDRW